MEKVLQIVETNVYGISGEKSEKISSRFKCGRINIILSIKVIICECVDWIR